MTHLLFGINLCSFPLPGVWVTAYILNEIHEEISWLQIASRFLLLITVCHMIGLCLIFFIHLHHH